MEIINSKILSYEEDVVEYENNDEFINDCRIRKEQGWSLVCKNKADFYNERLDKSPLVRIKYVKGGNHHSIYRWKRYGGVQV